MNDSIKYWLALKWVEGVGNRGFVSLLNHFGTPAEVFRASLAELRTVAGIGENTAGSVKSFNRWDLIEKELSLTRADNAEIITCRDPRYPQALLQIHDYPPLLYVKGSLRDEDINIAVVGSRRATKYGEFTTERLCRDLALRGITIVSGLAKGIDAAAHRGCMAVRGRTIAVLGCGLDVVYPPQNKELFKKIPLQGAIITEFPFGTPPDGPNFPARNRIISGISLGVVVVEANYKSGSLITARMALEQNREVFAVPGSIDAAESRGTNKLIKEGAKLVESAEDVIEEIMPQIGGRQAASTMNRADMNKPPINRQADNHDIELGGNKVEGLTEKELAIMQHLTSNPVTVDKLISLTNEGAAEVQNSLLILELKGAVRQLPGKTYIRKEK